MRIPSPKTSRTSAPNLTLQPSQAQASPEAFGAATGRALTVLGSATAALGTYVEQQQEQKARFDTLRRFSAFQTKANAFMQEARRNADPTQANFAEVMAAEYANMEADFINNEVPPELQGEFAVRTAQLGEGFTSQALQHQYESTDLYFRRSVEDAYNDARISLDQDGSAENLDAQKLRISEMLAASGLSEAEQVAIQRQVFVGMEAASYKAEVRAGNIEASALGVGAGGRGGALELLREFTGLEDDALEEVISAAEEVGIEAVGGADLWDAMPDHAQAALISLISEEGELPPSVVEALRGGDLADVAAAVEALGGDRREAEAQILRGEVDLPAARLDTDPRYDDIPYEDRLALRADAEREAAAIINAQQQAETARNKELVNALHTSIFDGTAGQTDIDSAREQGWLTDIDDIVKAEKLLEDRTEELRFAQLGQAMVNGERVFVPGNEDHKKALNAMIGDQGLRAVEAMDSKYTDTTLLPIISASQGVPTDVADLLQGMIRAQDPTKAYWAFDLLNQIQRATPLAYDRLPEEVTKATQFWQDRKDYYSPEELLKRVRGPLDQTERTARQALRREGELLFSRDDSPLANFDPLSLFQAPGFIPFTTQQGQSPVTRTQRELLERDFQTLFLDNYERDGDVEAAKKSASDLLHQTWGITNVGADVKVMKFPPEKYYVPVRGNYNWLEEQLRAEGVVAEDEQFELVADMQTESEWGSGEPPSYLVVTVKDGVGEVLFDEDGNPYRHFFDFGAQQEADENAWREEQKAAQGTQDMLDIFNRAQDHSLNTGIPIPEEILEDMNQLLPPGTAMGAF